jgi:hypothetical protein
MGGGFRERNAPKGVLKIGREGEKYRMFRERREKEEIWRKEKIFATKDNREENREENHMIKEDTARGKECNYRIEERSTL